jgi:hypothetical protein
MDNVKTDVYQYIFVNSMSYEYFFNSVLINDITFIYT